MLEISPTDVHTALYSFIGVMLAEVVVKPIAIRIGQYLLYKLDGQIKIIPDWLSDPKKSH